MDASAAMGMARRQGLCDTKHVGTQYLWVQERIRNCEIELRKVPTTENLADLLIKHFAEAQMIYLLEKMGYMFPSRFSISDPNHHWCKG